jgi:hypothetical protein
MVLGVPSARLGPFWFAGDRWETIRMDSGSKMFPDPVSPDLEHTVRGGTLADLFAPTAPPPLPDRLTPKVLREAIASVLARVSANELAEECVRFGLPPEEAGEDGPWRESTRMSSGGSGTRLLPAPQTAKWQAGPASRTYLLSLP